MKKIKVTYKAHIIGTCQFTWQTVMRRTRTYFITRPLKGHTACK